MVRTKAESSSIRVAGGKAPRKVAHISSCRPNCATGSSDPMKGGNSYFPRETPVWQKEITTFFKPACETRGEIGSSSDEQCNVSKEVRVKDSTSEGPSGSCC
ncbi:uncharacterized protein [Periplaneta americana]|uniref:uncharacterized protein n=1 Tax=Periplaneta americana TaxID=6978 RepID=UPI0037E8A1D7